MKKVTLALMAAAMLTLSGCSLYKSTPPAAPSAIPQPPASPQVPSQPVTPPAPEAAKEPAAESNVITFSDEGFSPASLQVKVGTAVTFRNNSTSSVWPASAKHPTHTVYPTTGGCIGSTFDACKGILPGGEWSFTFEKIGSWKYHDHLNPTRFGGVEVVE